MNGQLRKPRAQASVALRDYGINDRIPGWGSLLAEH